MASYNARCLDCDHVSPVITSKMYAEGEAIREPNCVCEDCGGDRLVKAYTDNRIGIRGCSTTVNKI